MGRALARALVDARGAVAPIFAVVGSMVVAPLALISLDVYAATSQKAKLQDAVDAATLYAARSQADNSAQLTEVGHRALKANLELFGGDPSRLKSYSFVLEANGRVTGQATVDAPTFVNWCSGGTFCWVGGPLTADSEVVRSIERVEIALVLDNTGSMQGQKLATLKTAAKNMIDTLQDAAAKSSQADAIRISLVPFSNTVRVQGTTSMRKYRPSVRQDSGAPAWIDQRARAHWVNGVSQDIVLDLQHQTRTQDRFRLLKLMKESWAGCVESRRPPFDVDDTAPTEADVRTLFIPYFWPDDPDTTGAYNNYIEDVGGSDWMTWLKSRKKYQLVNNGNGNGNGQGNNGNGNGNWGYDVDSNIAAEDPEDTEPGNPRFAWSGPFSMDSSGYGGPYIRGPNAGCVLQPIIGLTTNYSSLKTAIDGMTAVGETNITLGLMWGWHTISPSAPFPDGTAYATPNVKKVIVLMTDGENTWNDPVKAGEGNGSFYGGLGYIWQSFLPGITASSTAAQRRAAMDARLALACQNAKNRGIEIYTLAVEAPAAATPLLRSCASNPAMFYEVSDIAQLNAAFQKIAGSITDLRISR